MVWNLENQTEVSLRNVVAVKKQKKKNVQCGQLKPSICYGELSEKKKQMSNIEDFSQVLIQPCDVLSCQRCQLLSLLLTF